MDEENTDEVAEGPGVWATLDGTEPTTTTHTHTTSVTVDADLVAIGLAAVFGLAVGVVVGRAAR
jgi:hypothetical protein